MVMNKEKQVIEQLVMDAERYQGEPEAFGSLLTEKALLINFTGVKLVGRNEIIASMKSAMKTSLAHVKTQNKIESVVFLRPDVAIANGIKRISFKNENDKDEILAARLTFVFVKDAKLWRIASIQNTPIQ